MSPVKKILLACTLLTASALILFFNRDDLPQRMAILADGPPSGAWVPAGKGNANSVGSLTRIEIDLANQVIQADGANGLHYRGHQLSQPAEAPMQTAMIEMEAASGQEGKKTIRLHLNQVAVDLLFVSEGTETRSFIPAPDSAIAPK